MRPGTAHWQRQCASSLQHSRLALRQRRRAAGRNDGRSRAGLLRGLHAVSSQADGSTSASRQGLITSRRALMVGMASAGAVLSPSPPQSRAADAAVLPAPPSTKLAFEERVQEFTLPNGLHFIVLPRATAPVVSVHVYADVGAFQEKEGATGLAHLLEHMAFKGTRRVGARDWPREAALLDAMDDVFYEMRDAKAQARQQGLTREQAAASPAVARLDARLRDLLAQAADLVEPNAFGALLSRAGALDLNATTSHDATRYFASLPANKLELWFALEAERFRAPVFRELYSEKRVIEEERRLRVDDAPLGTFQQEFAARALRNNYRRPVIGWAEDFDGLGRREVANFFAQHYGPGSLTIALVGDVTVEQVQRLADKYWGSWAGAAARPGTAAAAAAVAGGVATVDAGPAGAGLVALPGSWAWRAASSNSGSAPGSLARAVTASAGGPPAARVPWSTLGLKGCVDGATASGAPCISDTSVGGPLVMVGYHRPPGTSPDGVAIQMLSDVLSGSRTSRLTRDLVLERRRLRSVRFYASYPGDKYDGMCLLAAQPVQGQQPEEAERLVLEELRRFTNEGPTSAELARVQRATRISVLGSALSNSAMASLLASYHALTGSWRGLLKELDQVASMTPSKVLDVAQKVLVPSNSFTGYVYTDRG